MAVIAFIVRVPVLSVLMTVVPPRVSTSVSDLTTALCSASRRAPDDSMACTKVGSPVGMEAIAVEMHNSSRVVVSWPRARPKMAMISTAANAIVPNTLVMLSSSRCSGDWDRWVAVTMVAILPISVALPVAVTTIVAVPRVTWVFWNTRFVRSPSAVSPSGSVPGSLGIGALSPVSAASCTSSVAEEIDPPVGRHHVAGLEQHDVARHQPGRFELLDLAGPPHPGVRHLQLGQRVHAGAGLQLLAGAHHHVEQHQPQHHQRRRDLDDREAAPRPRAAA